MLEKIFASLLSQGLIGIILAFFMYLVYQLIGKLFKVIETNTQAWTNVHERLGNIENNSKRRREDYSN